MFLFFLQDLMKNLHVYFTSHRHGTKERLLTSFIWFNHIVAIFSDRATFFREWNENVYLPTFFMIDVFLCVEVVCVCDINVLRVWLNVTFCIRIRESERITKFRIWKISSYKNDFFSKDEKRLRWMCLELRFDLFLLTHSNAFSRFSRFKKRPFYKKENEKIFRLWFITRWWLNCRLMWMYDRKYEWKRAKLFKIVKR